MPKGKSTNQGPPPLPDVAADDGSHVAPPPLPDEASQDAAPRDPTAEFLARAGAVIALDRGINARSRVKLAAIADELELSDDDFAAAMEQLQGGDSEREKQLTREELRSLRRRKRAFHDHVGQTLMALPHGVLTASMEQMLAAVGVDEHDLPADEARADIVELAGKLRIRRITLDEAQRHVAGLVDLALKPSGVLRDDVRARIVAEASRWGLTPDGVEPILREQLSRHRMGERKDQMRMVGLVSAAAAVLVGVLGMVGWMAATRAMPNVATAQNETDGESIAADGEDSTAAPADAGEADGGDPAPREKRFGVPDWWDDDLASYIANVRLRSPSLERDLYQLRSPDAEARGDAYGGVMFAAATGDFSENDRAIIGGLLAAAYAVDPSEDCAERLRETWMDLAVHTGESLEQLSTGYGVSLWLVDTAALALLHEDLSPERRAALLDAVDRAFSASLDRGLAPLQLRRQMMATAGRHLYRALTRHAVENIDVAVDLHAKLLAEVDAFLDAPDLDRLGANFLRQVLPKLGERWVIYEDLIHRCAHSEDPLNVLLMVELFEATEIAALRRQLGAELIARTGLSITKGTVAELAAAVREELGVVGVARPIDNAKAAADWRIVARDHLESTPPGADDSEVILEDILQSARLATMGAALAQGELGAAEFSALASKEPPTLSGPRRAPGGGPPRAPRVSASTLKNLDRNIDTLRGYARMDKARRLSFFQIIAGYASRVTDVQPEQGQAIAAYLAAGKSVDEHQRVMTRVESVLRWRMVRLGLADQLAESRLRTEHLDELLTKALRREVDTQADGWRGRLRNELLANVARELSTEVSLAGASTDAADRAAEALADYYRTRAKLLGVGAAEFGAAGAPSDLLLATINHVAAQLSAASLPAGDREALSQVPHRIAAINYVVENDIARTSSFQRLLLELLIIEAGRGDAKGRRSLAAIPSNLQLRDARAGNALRQLADGERAMVQLWLARNGP